MCTVRGGKALRMLEVSRVCYGGRPISFGIYPLNRVLNIILRQIELVIF